MIVHGIPYGHQKLHVRKSVHHMTWEGSVLTQHAQAQNCLWKHVMYLMQNRGQKLTIIDGSHQLRLTSVVSIQIWQQWRICRTLEELTWQEDVRPSVTVMTLFIVLYWEQYSQERYCASDYEVDGENPRNAIQVSIWVASGTSLTNVTCLLSSVTLPKFAI